MVDAIKGYVQGHNRRGWAKLITLVGIGFIFIVIVVAAIKGPRPERNPKSNVPAESKITAETEAAAKAREEAERQAKSDAEAERQRREAERQRQVELQIETERRAEEAKRLRAYQAAIAKCVEDVRRPNAFSKFDMYTTKSGELRGWGTEHEVYLFNKCMEQRGYDTQVESLKKSSR